MQPYFDDLVTIDDRLLRVIAYLPTSSLPHLSTPSFWGRLNDAHIMRIAVYLAQKSYDEAGCPIGAVIIDDETRCIVGKGHNTLVQENHPYNHGGNLCHARCRLDRL